MRLASLAKFEYAIVLAIFGVLATLLLERLVALEHETEQLEVSLTIRHIHVGLKLAIGERIMRGEEAKIAALVDENPLNFLGDTQKVGLGAGEGQNIGAGRTAWQYDPATRILSYQVRQPEAFDGRARLEWRFTGHVDTLGRNVGLRLEPLK